ncbi:MAG: serine/threonine-protein kinase, partial [Deltaproteobacteria bacterium]|nr:serine/threonine-protein kinase [Deltaproteobacteria bacterium]
MATGADNQEPPEGEASTGGRVLGRYELLTEIASGGMASVFLGRARGVAGFERVVAVKVCHPHLRVDEEFAEMFLDEARLAAKIHHPNVVSTLDVGDDDGRLYLVMEYIEGDRLSGLIKAAGKKGRRIPPAVAARIFIDLLSGLHAAHELADTDGTDLSVVHRDVSPQNVLVGVDGVARITDFGIAKTEARVTVTSLKQIKGKLAYMAPEQLEGVGVNRRTDLYAAGVVLWETLAGKRLFRGETDVETVQQVLKGAVRRPSEIVPDLDPAFDAVVMKAIERDPALRFATAAEFAEALEELPLKLANARAVSAVVQELQGEVLTARRDLVRRIGEGEALVLEELTSPSAVRFARTDLSLSLASSLPPPLPPPVAASLDDEADADLPAPSPPRRRALLVAVPVLLLLLVAAGLALRPSRPAEHARPQ